MEKPKGRALWFALLNVVFMVFTPNATLAAQLPYSDGALQRPPVMDQSEALVHSVAVNNWLNSNFEGLAEAEYQAVVERLYAILGSMVQNEYQSSGLLIPESVNPVMPLLFSWAGRLGIIGASEVGDALRAQSDSVTSSGPAPEPPPGFEVTAELPHLRIASESLGWQVSIPYFFMVGMVGPLPNAPERTAEILMVSTLHAPHLEVEGHSQATILLVVDKTDPSQFEANWVSAFQLDSNARNQSDLVGSGSVYPGLSLPPNMHSEAHIWSNGELSFAALYSGVSGTFEANHDHFRDFVRNLVY